MLFPRGRRRSNCDDVLQREPIERRAVAGPLQQVEQRQPGERRELGVLVVRDAVLEQRAGLLGWPLAYISAAFSSTAHRPGLAWATSIAGWAAADQSTRLGAA